MPGELLAQAGAEANEALTLLKDGIAKVPVGNLFSLYQSAGELLLQEGKADEAITLLKKGWSRIPDQYARHWVIEPILYQLWRSTKNSSIG